jgi:hypothetical protein
MSDVKIPEDLREQYELNKKWLALLPVGRPRSTGSIEAVLRSDCVQMAERIAQQEAEIERLREANELDRRSLWGFVKAIDEEITGRMWLIEGRGPYEWDDDKYRQEFGWAVHALQEKLEPLRKIAHDLTNCPETEKGVDSVRKLEATVERLKGLLREWRMNMYPRDHYQYCRASVQYLDWPKPKDDRCDLCKRTDQELGGESK